MINYNNYYSNGCTYATEVLGRQSSCLECPFRECIFSLKPAEKHMIMQSDIIRHIYLLLDTGHTIGHIAREYADIPLSQLDYWIKNRARTEQKIADYGIVENLAVVTNYHVKSHSMPFFKI